MLYYPDKHFHYSKEKGLSVRGNTDTPGVLCAGRVYPFGVIRNAWGAKKNKMGENVPYSEKTPGSAGRYKVYHSIGHTNYIVTLTIEGAERLVARVMEYATTYFIAEFNYPGAAHGTTYDCAFSYMCVGDNY